MKKTLWMRKGKRAIAYAKGEMGAEVEHTSLWRGRRHGTRRGRNSLSKN